MTELITQEEILFQTKSKTLTVTNQRAVYHLDTGQHAQITVIMLEDICSCSVSRNKPWILLLIGAVLGIVGLAGMKAEEVARFVSTVARAKDARFKMRHAAAASPNL